MKTIGLIGEMSLGSSVDYYNIRLINHKIQGKLGGYHSCKSILFSVDFSEIQVLQKEGNWQKLDNSIIDTAQKLEKAGAEIIILCTNTMHFCYKTIIQNIQIYLYYTLLKQ